MDSCVAFIGIGNIARRIIGGLVRGGFAQEQIVVAGRNKAGLERFCADYPKLIQAASNAEAAARCPLFVLCVKPADMPSLCTEIAPHIDPSTVLVSLAAGVPAQAIAQWSSGHTEVVRCMPNTPVAVSQGVAAMYLLPQASEQSRLAVHELFEHIAMPLWLDDEARINVATALCGSGPAYFFALADIFEGIAREYDYQLADAKQFALDILHYGYDFFMPFHNDYQFTESGMPCDMPLESCQRYLAGQKLAKEAHALLYAACLAGILLFTRGLIRCAINNGFEQQTAMDMIGQTLSGALALAATEGDFNKLRDQVVSKGGTTECGLAVLARSGLPDMFKPEQMQDITDKQVAIQAIAHQVFEAANERASTLAAEVSYV